jgi:hypothetical protein
VGNGEPPDRVNGTWVPAGSLVIPRAGAAAARVGRYIYLFGGCTEGGLGLNSVERYDVRTGTSILLPVTMPGAFGGDKIRAAAATLAGHIHVTGGKTSSGFDDEPNHIIFHPRARQNTGTFTASPHPFPTHCPVTQDGRTSHGLVSHAGQLFAVGGWCEESSFIPGVRSESVLEQVDAYGRSGRDGGHDHDDHGGHGHDHDGPHDPEDRDED